MLERARVFAPNPHALAPAAGASLRHRPGAVMAAATAGDAAAAWPLRLGRIWPGLPALCAPRHPVLDLNGGPQVADEAAAALVRQLLDAERWPKSWPRLIAARAIGAQGPAWDALAALAEDGLIGLHRTASWERSLLERAAAPDAAAYLERFVSGGERKALRRKRRRLEEEGGLTLTIHHAPDGIAAALEIFCGLESAGWKGRNGTALAQDAAGRAYVADVLASMGEAGSALAAVLCAGAEPIAAGLFLRAGGEAVFWKTAYDERRARHSPGVVFDVMLTEWLYDQPWFERLDAGHDDSVDPATLLWGQRRPMADVLIDLRPGSLRGRLALAGAGLRRRLREAKRRYGAK